MKRGEIKMFLEEAYLKYDTRRFIEPDPIRIPHRFTKREDIEIAGFLAATIAWGNRKSILKNAERLMTLLDNDPHNFVTGYSKKEIARFETFVHRTFNGKDCRFFIEALRNIYLTHGGLEKSFSLPDKITDDQFPLKDRIINFRKLFLEVKHLPRSEKHISNPAAKSSAKRLCMFLRWMVRKDKRGVDFGIWNSIEPKDLCLPLDVHTGNVSRALKLLSRKQNDWQAVQEITSVLRLLDPHDPVKYDFALFGLGVDGFLK